MSCFQFESHQHREKYGPGCCQTRVGYPVITLGLSQTNEWRFYLETTRELYSGGKNVRSGVKRETLAAF